MLRGSKSLAYFSEFLGHEPTVCLRYWRMFDRHAAAGRLIRRETVEAEPEQPHLQLRRLFYALPGHEWRIDGMLALVREPGPWSDERERRFGELLGYEPWQMDFWLTHRIALGFL